MADITVRKVRFDFPDELDDVFPGANPVDETYLVAFSLTMPYLEPYLIRTYRAVADRIDDPALAHDVEQFIAQEAQHFQNHRRINEIIKSRLEPAVADRLRQVEADLNADYRRYSERRSDHFNLVYAEGFEAMTCAMALTLFARAAEGRGASAEGRFGAWQQLWAWHAAEEIEHRTVAFGVYQHLEGSWPRRAVGALWAQLHFHRTIDRFQRILLPTQGMRARPHLPGWLRDGAGRYLRTFLPGYDPGTLQPGPLVDLVLAPYADD
jgi:predicted metal-dependent hydrolase